MAKSLIRVRSWAESVAASGLGIGGFCVAKTMTRKFCEASLLGWMLVVLLPDSVLWGDLLPADMKGALDGVRLITRALCLWLPGALRLTLSADG